MDEQQQVSEAGDRGQGRRLGVGAWLAAWLVITGPQAYALVQGLGVAEAPVQAAAWGAAALALQGIKAWATVPRLRDLGRPPDDVLWAFVPVLNVVLFFQALRPAPPEDARLRRVRSWAGQVTAVQAYVRAARFLAPTAWAGLLGALVSGALAWLGLGFVDRVLGVPTDAVPAVLQGATVASGVLTVYTLMQWTKRRRASRASWLPSLLLLPTLALTATFYLRVVGGPDAGLAIVVLASIGWSLLVVPWVGALLAGLWIVGADRARRGAPASPGAVLAELTPRAADVVIGWGGRFQIVQVGLQVLIPGVWYAIAFAFSDAIAVLRPERPVFAGSTELSRGIRGKLFKVLAVDVLGVTLVQLAIWTAFAGFGVAMLVPLGLVDPSTAPPQAVVLASAAGSLVTWWGTLAVLVVFYERDALLTRKRERAAVAAGGVAGARP